MPKTSRRDFLKFAGAASAASALSFALPMGAFQVVGQEVAVTLGRVTIVNTPTGRIHTYNAPDASGRVTTHIIETADSLVVIDTQLLKPFAAEAAAYAGSLGKPIERVILSHEHADHVFGAENFDAPIVATAATAANVAAAIESGAAGQQAASFGDAAPTELITPEAAIELGSETIAGLTFEFSAYENAEALENLVIRVPEAQTAILQDLMYNAVYFFPGLDRNVWIAALEDLRVSLKADGYETLLVGHGMPTTLGALDTGIEFLQFLEEQYTTAESGEAVAEAIVSRYPSYNGEVILGFYPAFFPQN